MVHLIPITNCPFQKHHLDPKGFHKMLWKQSGNSQNDTHNSNCIW